MKVAYFKMSADELKAALGLKLELKLYDVQHLVTEIRIFVEGDELNDISRGRPFAAVDISNLKEAAEE